MLLVQILALYGALSAVLCGSGFWPDRWQYWAIYSIAIAISLTSMTVVRKRER